MKDSKKSRPPIIDDDGEIRELDEEDFRLFRPAKEVLPPDLYEGLVSLKKGRGPQKTPTKKAISIRLSEEVLQYFRKTGMGWHTRIDDALKEWVKQQETA